MDNTLPSNLPTVQMRIDTVAPQSRLKQAARLVLKLVLVAVGLAAGGLLGLFIALYTGLISFNIGC